MKRLAILAMAAASVVMTPVVAHAQNGTAHYAATPKQAESGTARYAMLQSCPKADYSVPCGSWTIILRNGKKLVLKDAQVFPVVGGKVSKDSSVPINLSADGRRVAYFRKSDRHLVIRDLTTNKVITLPAKAARVPKDLTMSDVGTFLSGDGTLLVIDYFDDPARRQSLIVEVDTGEVRTLKGNESVDSVTSHGDYILTSQYTSENTWRYTAYDRAGNAANSQVVPQIVANNSPVALADDGTTMAVIVGNNPSGMSLRTYDLANDTIADKINISIPKKELAQRVLWDASDRLTLWTFRDIDNHTATRTASWRVDAGSGAAKETDSFKIKSNVWDYRLPGA